jgi:hypothetical protein
MGTGMNGKNMWMMMNGMNSNHAMNGQYNSNMMAQPQHCGHGNNGHGRGHQTHYASSNQSQSYFSSNDLVLQMRIIMRDYPLVYQHMEDQTLLIREQQVEADRAAKEIAALKRQISSFNDNRGDKVPPIILVGKDEECSSSKDDDTAIESSAPLKKRFVSRDEGTSNDADTLDSLPFKKRHKRYGSKQDINTVLATLQAATSPSFERKFRF